LKKTEYEKLKKLKFDSILELIESHIKDEDENKNATIISIAVLSLVLIDTQNQAEFYKFLENTIVDGTTTLFLGRIIKEYKDLLVEVAQTSELDKLKALALFFDPKNANDKKTNSLPDSISNLVIALLSVDSNDRILDLGTYKSSFLIDASYNTKSRSIIRYDKNTENVIIANFHKYITGLSYQINQGDFMKTDLKKSAPNKVFAHYNFNEDWNGGIKEIRDNQNLNHFFKDKPIEISADWLYGLAAYSITKMPGKCIILIPNRANWSVSDFLIRERVIEEGILESVILLPSNLFPDNETYFSLLILSQNNKQINMFDASKLFKKRKKQNFLNKKEINMILKEYQSDTMISKTVSIDRVRSNRYVLDPRLYLDKENSIFNEIPLGDLCKFIRSGVGNVFIESEKYKYDTSINYRYLSQHNIHTSLFPSELPSISIIDKKYKRKCVEDGNLMISKKPPFRMGVVHSYENEVILANNDLFFFEIDNDKINPIYVLAFLESELGLEQLNRFLNNSKKKELTLQDLMSVKIFNIPREKQDKIAYSFEDIMGDDELLYIYMESLKNNKKVLL